MLHIFLLLLATVHAIMNNENHCAFGEHYNLYTCKNGTNMDVRIDKKVSHVAPCRVYRKSKNKAHRCGFQDYGKEIRGGF